jgi:hypothetical protein
LTAVFLDALLGRYVTGPDESFDVIANRRPIDAAILGDVSLRGPAFPIVVGMVGELNENQLG